LKELDLENQSLKQQIQELNASTTALRTQLDHYSKADKHEQRVSEHLSNLSLMLSSLGTSSVVEDILVQMEKIVGSITPQALFQQIVDAYRNHPQIRSAIREIPQGGSDSHRQDKIIATVAQHVNLSLSAFLINTMRKQREQKRQEAELDNTRSLIQADCSMIIHHPFSNTQTLFSASVMPSSCPMAYYKSVYACIEGKLAGIQKLDKISSLSTEEKEKHKVAMVHSGMVHAFVSVISLYATKGPAFRLSYMTSLADSNMVHPMKRSKNPITRSLDNVTLIKPLEM
jgi:hypothetical protein